MRRLGIKRHLRESAGFAWRVLRNFGRNKGLLLASALAYNMLLSLIPLFAVLLVGLSQFFQEKQLISVLTTELDHVVPGYGDVLTQEVVTFLDNRQLFGVFGVFFVLFFSSLAFRVLEDSMGVIFARAGHKVERHYLVSALLPYAYILVVGLGLLALTAMTVILGAIAAGNPTIFGLELPIGSASSVLLYLGGLLGLVLLFASVYMVMPESRVRFRRALVGGITAAALWEATRYVLVWWFDSVSMVSVVYGSLATVIIILLTLEVASIILLLGAQVIADIETAAHAGVRWCDDPGSGEAPPPTFVERLEGSKMPVRTRTTRRLRRRRRP